MDPAVIVTIAGLAVWGVVIFRAVRRHADVVLLALVLIVSGLTLAQFFSAVGVVPPSAWAYLITGVALLVLWPISERRDGMR